MLASNLSASHVLATVLAETRRPVAENEDAACKNLEDSTVERPPYHSLCHLPTKKFPKTSESTNLVDARSKRRAPCRRQPLFPFPQNLPRGRRHCSHLLPVSCSSFSSRDEGFSPPTPGYQRSAKPNHRVFSTPIPVLPRRLRLRSRERRAARTACAGRDTPCPLRRILTRTREVGLLARASKGWTMHRDRFHLVTGMIYRKPLTMTSWELRHARGTRKVRRRAIREGGHFVPSALRLETRDRLRRRVREAEGSTRHVHDFGDISVMCWKGLHAMFPHETRETRRRGSRQRDGQDAGGHRRAAGALLNMAVLYYGCTWPCLLWLYY